MSNPMSNLDDVPAFAPRPASAKQPTPDFARLWAAWMERGRRHDLAVRRKGTILAAIGVVAALLAVTVHAFFFS